MQQLEKWNNYRFLSIQLITSFTNKAQLITAHCSPFCTFSFSTVHGCSMSGDPSTCGHVVTSLLVPNGVESRKRLWFTNGSNAAILGGSRQHQKSTNFPMPPPNPGQNSWREFGPPKNTQRRGFLKVERLMEYRKTMKDPTKIQVRCDTWQWMILMQTR